MWECLISEDKEDGLVKVGALEWETLQVQVGKPACGYEHGVDRLRKEEAKKQEQTMEANDDDSLRNRKRSTSNLIKTSPLEIHLNSLINLDKGCYLGQEGIASVLKNPRGPPRILYAVVFEDDFNIYEAQSRGDSSELDNLTTLPKPGQKLYALGSNRKLQVGYLTSVGEAGGTGDRNTIALALNNGNFVYQTN